MDKDDVELGDSDYGEPKTESSGPSAQRRRDQGPLELDANKERFRAYIRNANK